jgi:hypothetical protein
MAYLVSQLKSDVDILLHNAFEQITGQDDLIETASRDLMLFIDSPNTKRRYEMVNAVYDGVNDYAVPSDLKGNKVIDIVKQINRTERDNFTQTFAEQFDQYKRNNSFVVEDRDGTKFIRLSKSVGDKITIDTVNGITDNGTWSVGGDATNLTEDGAHYISGSSSLNFDLDGSTTSGYLEKTLTTSIDLSLHEDKSSIFVWFYFPDSSLITNLILRWGNDSSNYWSKTVTTPHFGSFVDGWNLVRFDWNGATETGTPTSSTVDYLRITVTYDGTADEDIRMDNMVSLDGEIFYIDYYSKYLFKNSSGTWSDTISADTDTINLDTEGYNLLTYRVAELAAISIQGGDSGVDSSLYGKKYAENLLKYTNQYKSEAEKKKQNYYRRR